MDIINYLKDAQLVANFQNFFGIHFLVECNGQLANNKSEHLENECKNDKLKQRHAANGINEKIKYKNGTTSTEMTNGTSSLESKSTTKRNYVISNFAFYYIFCFGASLGYEMFYALFFPFFMQNIDSFVGRRLIVIWSVVMYIGQALKDVIRWNRPESPPVIVLEPEYSMEYGMPSTHAMVGFALPFSIFIFTQSRYVYPFWLGFTLASIWCILVCGSRLYLGMHTILDVLAGILLSATILFISIPFIDMIDELHYKSTYSPLVSFSIICLMSIFYPKSDRWSPARGDTCVMIGFGFGTLIGTWMNFQLSTMTDLISPLPFYIHWPSKTVVLLMILRMTLTTLSVELVRIIGKKLIYPVLCKLQGLNSKDSESMKSPSVEVPLKLIVYAWVGINVACFIPICFKYMNLDL